MLPYTYSRASSPDDALRAVAAGARPLAGGTTLVDLMRLEVEKPERLVDIAPLAELRGIRAEGGALRIGALTTMAEAAEHPLLARDHPALAESLSLAASQQLREAATLAGNLLQRTRCPYFRDPGVAACNKRAPGSGCAAIEGTNRGLAVLGWTERCVANFPGDWGAALAAFDTAVEVRSASGRRSIPYEQFHRSYGEAPDVETTLRPGEVITAIAVRQTPMGRGSAYVKVRDRESYAYALASAAVAMSVENGRVREARVALGGLATRPWRSREAEARLVGQPAGEDAARAAGEAALAGARPLSENGFKIELGRRTVAQAVLAAAERARA